MNARAFLPVVFVITLASCGTGAGDGGTTITGDPSRYLLTIDQLSTPDFTVSTAAHAIDASTLAAGDTTQTQLLNASGFAGAAGVEFFRQADLGTANGPLDIANTVARFSAAAGAATVFNGDVQRLDAGAGAVPVSAGTLGDQAHAISVVRTTTGGLQAVQVTLEWRVANVINVIVVRGRYGGTRLDDALTLAKRVTPAEQAAASGG